MSTGESSDIYTGTAVRAICTSPASSILGADVIGHILQFKWKDGGEELELVHSVETNITNIRCMCYVEQNDAVVLSCRYPGRVCAFDLSDGSNLWEFNQQINREDIDPRGLCHDTDGRIYMAHWKGGIIAIDSRTGDLLQQMLQDVEHCCDISWTSASPHLTLLHGVGSVISLLDYEK